MQKIICKKCASCVFQINHGFLCIEQPWCLEDAATEETKGLGWWKNLSVVRNSHRQHTVWQKSDAEC